MHARGPPTDPHELGVVTLDAGFSYYPEAGRFMTWEAAAPVAGR